MLRFFVLFGATALAGCGGPAPQEAEIFVADVVVKTRPTVQAPEMADYPDCLVAFELEPVRGDLEEAFLGITWAFQERVPDRSATLVEGSKIRATLSKLSPEAKEKLSEVQLLDDSEDWNLDRYWLEDWAVMSQSGVGTGAETLALPHVDRSKLPPLQAGLIVDEETAIQRDGWIFRLFARSIYRPKFWEIPGALSNGAVGAREAITDFAEQLEAAGIPLVLVIVPRSTSIYPGRTLDMPYSPESDRRANAPVADFVKLLQDDGVDVLDLTPLYLERRSKISGPDFLSNDSHWSPQGARAAAVVISEHLVNRYDIPAREAREAAAATYLEKGDYGFLLDDPSTLPVIETSVIVPEVDPPGSDGEVAVIGDSFLGKFRDEKAGFGDHIAARVDVEVSAFAVAAGVTASRRRLVRERGIDGLSVVVWQVAEDLLANHEAWRLVPIAPGAEKLLSNPDASGWNEPEPGQFVLPGKKALLPGASKRKKSPSASPSEKQPETCRNARRSAWPFSRMRKSSTAKALSRKKTGNSR